MTVNINDIFILDAYYFNKNIKDNEDMINFIDKITVIKNYFINSKYYKSKDYPIVDFFSNIFIHSESIIKKDLATYPDEQIRNMLRYLKENQVIMSNSMYKIYTSLINEYSEFAYHNKLRDDILSLSVKSSANIRKNNNLICNSNPLFYNALTYNEMINISQRCSEFTEIIILLMLEGIKILEIYEFETSDFECGDNHIITKRNREILLSKSLYLKIRNYIINNEDVSFSRSRVIYLSPKDLSSINLGMIKLNSFRESSIFNDALDGMDISDINKKYNLTYVKIDIMPKYKDFTEIIKMKRILEGTL